MNVKASPAIGRPARKSADERYGYTSIRLRKDVMAELDELIALKRADGQRVSRNSVIEAMLVRLLKQELTMARQLAGVRQVLAREAAPEDEEPLEGL